MTRSEIIATRKSPLDLYKTMVCPSGPQEAAKEPLLLGMMVNDFVNLSTGYRITYSGAFCYAALTSMLNKKRGLSLPDDLVRQTALLWVQTFPDWTFADVRLFEHMFITGLLPTYSLSGKEVLDLISLDVPGVFDKLHAYNKKRPGYIKRLNQSGINKAMGNMNGSTGECRQRPPVWEIDPEAQRYDLLGVEHPPDWDYKTYWAGKADPEETEHIVAKIKELRFNF